MAEHRGASIPRLLVECGRGLLADSAASVHVGGGPSALGGRSWRCGFWILDLDFGSFGFVRKFRFCKDSVHQFRRIRRDFGSIRIFSDRPINNL